MFHGPFPAVTRMSTGSDWVLTTPIFPTWLRHLIETDQPAADAECISSVFHSLYTQAAAAVSDAAQSDFSPNKHRTKKTIRFIICHIKCRIGPRILNIGYE
jgi:hypothetical protein